MHDTRQRPAVHYKHQWDNITLQCIIAQKKKANHHVHTTCAVLTMTSSTTIIPRLASFGTVLARYDAASGSTHLGKYATTTFAFYGRRRAL